jgi:glyoxylase-like metal-dependent hydrolase (beta-lactamase superfamily II)
MQWKISPVLGGEFGMVRDDIKFVGGNPSATAMVPSLLFLLEHEDRQVVIDTSFRDPRDAEYMGLVIKREGTIEARIRAAGIIPEKVEVLLLTHTHWDHADNCDVFTDALVYCQQKDYDYAIENPDYSQRLKKTLAGLGRRLVLLQGTADILPGIQAVFIGGHTPGSQMFVIDSSVGKAIITGDDVMTFANVENNIPVGLCVNPPACLQALEYIRQNRGALLFPSHDYRTLDYLQNPEHCRYL